MSIPSTGAVAFSDLRDEYQDTNPIALSDYYSDGSLLTAGMLGEYGIPASAAISVDDFRPSELSWFIVAGSLGGVIGYDSGSFGTLDKAAIQMDGFTIVTVTTSSFSVFSVVLTSAPDDHFTTVDIEGSFAGGTNPRIITYTESAASYAAGIWSWTSIPANDELVDTNSYRVAIVK